MTALLILAGCASAPLDHHPNIALIAPDRALDLPLPGELGRSVEAVQLITVRRDGETFSFEGHISIDPTRLYLVGLDSLGRRALTVTWHGAGSVQAQMAPWLPKAIMPGPMLADLVVLYWPEPVVRRVLRAAGAELVVAPGRRAVLVDGVVIFQAEYASSPEPGWTGRLRYRNESWGYEIDVQSVEAAP